MVRNALLLHVLTDLFSRYFPPSLCSPRHCALPTLRPRLTQHCTATLAKSATSRAVQIAHLPIALTTHTGQVKIWDLRNSYANLHSYFTVRPASSAHISDTGMLALGFGPHVQVSRLLMLSERLLRMCACDAARLQFCIPCVPLITVFAIA